MAFTKIAAAGIGSTETVTLHSLEVLNNATVGGVLTYEDVTNVDSIGIVTARAGVLVGSGITLSKDGDIFATGISTAEHFHSTDDLVVDDQISAGGKFLLGHTSSRTVGDRTHLIQIEGTALQDGGLSMVRNRNDEHSTSITLAKTRGSSTGANTIVQSGDSIGEFAFAAGDGTDVVTRAGRIHCEIDGTPGANDMPGRLILSTTADAGSSPTERLRITSGGRILIATTSEGHGNADDLTIATAGGSLGNTGITIRSSTTGDGNIFFSDATSGDGETKGVIKYAHNTDHMQFNTGGTERLRLTSTGQVFIGDGVTSSYDMVLLRNTDGNTVAQIVNTNTGSSVQSILQLQVGSDRYVNFSANYTNQYLQLQGVNITTTYSDFDTHIFRTNSGTEKMRLDSSGDLQVKGGQITISKAGALNHLEIGSGQTSSQYAYMDLIGDTTYTDYGLRVIRGNTGANAVSQILHRGTGAFDISTQDAASLNLYTGSVKRLEIDSNGAMYPTQNGAYFHFKAQSGFLVPAIFQNTGNNVNYTMIQFRGWNGTQSGTISTRVDLTTYATSSDARLKENIVDTSNGIERVKQLRPVQFNFIANKEETMDGFLAQEAKNVVPVSVTGDPDAVDKDGNVIPMGMDNSKLVPILTKALQEAIAKIETLETKVSALEG